MNLAFFPCCISSAFLEQYETATRVVMAELGIEVQGRRDFNCCGYPLKGCNYGAYIHLSAKNLALSEKHGFYLMTPCGCCYGSLKYVETLLKQNSSLRDDVNSALSREGLEYAGTTVVKHVLEVLLEEVGIEKLQSRLEKKYQGVKVATHYGCHLLRPGKIVNFDNPFRPVKFDQLVKATGAESIPWSEKLECCGAPLLGVNDPVAFSLTGAKLGSAKRAKADYICSACPCCHFQFEKAREVLLSEHGVDFKLPSITYIQMLGVCLGIEERLLGFFDPGPAALEMPRALRHQSGSLDAVQ